MAENSDTSSEKTAAEEKQTTREKKRVSKKEKLEQRIAQLQAEIQAENAKLNAINRKERNGQLIAFGIFLETFLKNSSPDDWKQLIEAMKELVDGRNLERCLAGIRRLLGEVKASPKRLAEFEPLLVRPVSDEKTERKDKSGSPEEEISPEPPSQLPEAEAQEKNQGSA